MILVSLTLNSDPMMISTIKSLRPAHLTDHLRVMCFVRRGWLCYAWLSLTAISFSFFFPWSRPTSPASPSISATFQCHFIQRILHVPEISNIPTVLYNLRRRMRKGSMLDASSPFNSLTAEQSCWNWQELADDCFAHPHCSVVVHYSKPLAQHPLTVPRA